MPLPTAPTISHLLRQLASRLSRPSLYVYLTLAMSALGLMLGHQLSQSTGMAQLTAVAGERLELYAASLEAELARHAYLPSLIAIDEDVRALLDTPGDAELSTRVARKLAGISVRSGARQLLVLAPDGRLLADSQGQHGQAAPELTRALVDGLGHYFIRDARNGGSTDFVQLHALRRQGRLLGAVVVRINLAPLEATWADLGLRSQSEKLLVLDEQDVVIMSSVPAWRYRTLGAVEPDRLARLQSSERYGSEALPALGIERESLAQADASLLPVPASEGQPPSASARLLAQQRSMPPLGLRLVTLSDPAEVWRQARYAAWGGAAFGASLGLLALYLASRRRALQQLFQAKTELQLAHGQLEKLVDERTAELRSTNAELKRQIAQRLRAEDELVQAGKLAVLGQMSAGISHELNQPLTALRALSRNTQLLQQGGRHETVAENLRTIDAMVERMSLITRQLKSFARKAESATATPVSLAAAVRNVLLLLEHRIRAEQVKLRIDVSDSLRVNCDPNRLEQVLLNLCANAMDAMQGSGDERELAISTEPGGQRVRVRVADTGSGIAPALMPRLFEPFFTTKPAGQGLGLGLVISSKIVHEFGGSLQALPGEVGMVFEFDLELARHV